MEHAIADSLGTRHVVVTGAGGQLGAALLETFPAAVGLTRSEWDVSLPPPPLGDVDLVLHAAAWTNVGDPRWSSTTDTSSRSAPRRSIVSRKFFDVQPKSHELRTIHACSPATASPCSFDRP